MRMETPRKTNVLRPFYRLGWLAIWGSWLFMLIVVVPSPESGTFGWLFSTVAVTTVAWVLHRLWDRRITGRPLPRRR